MSWLITLNVLRAIVVLTALGAAYVSLHHHKIGRCFLLLTILFIETNVLTKYLFVSINVNRLVNIIFFLTIIIVIFVNGYDWKLEKSIERFIKKIF
jgi:hypothetical protein